MTETRKTTSRNVAWFLDLRRRDGGLDLDPPYQRRSVWNQSYRDYFIDTVLLDLPVPAIFLFESISEEGSLSYSVVDGKQRLTTVFDFVDDVFPVSEKSKVDRLRGKYFSEFSADEKQDLVYTYTIPVEVLPGTDEGALDEIFERINRNVSRLSHQELRHARFYGDFATAVDNLTVELFEQLPERFPNIAASSRRQMKDTEFMAILLLLVENGPQSTPQAFLDQIYAERDEEWESKSTVTRRLRRIISYIAEIAEAGGAYLQNSRLRNQGDFYALIGAVDANLSSLPEAGGAAERLYEFMERVGDEGGRATDQIADAYYEAARSAANDPRKRTARIEILGSVLLGE